MNLIQHYNRMSFNALRNASMRNIKRRKTRNTHTHTHTHTGGRTEGGRRDEHALPHTRNSKSTHCIMNLPRLWKEVERSRHAHFNTEDNYRLNYHFTLAGAVSIHLPRSAGVQGKKWRLPEHFYFWLLTTRQMTSFHHLLLAGDDTSHDLLVSSPPSSSGR